MIKLTPKLAEICGIHAGDGYMRFRERNKGEVDISGNIEEKNYYDNHVAPLFNKTFRLNITARYFQKGTYGIVIYKKQVRETLKELGFPSGKKSLIVKIPKRILNNKNKIIHARFLRGLFDTDGCLSFKKKNYGKFKNKYPWYPSISIKTISRNLAHEVSTLLNRLTLKNSITTYKPVNLKYKRSYTITLNGIESLNKWMKIISTKNPSKVSKYLIWKKFGFCPSSLTFQQRKDILKGKIDIYSLEPVV